MLGQKMSVSLALFASCFHAHNHIVHLLVEGSSVDSLLAHEDDQGLGSLAHKDGSAVTAFASDIYHVIFIHQQVAMNHSALFASYGDSR